MNMNGFFNQCRRRRQSLSLLASGALPETEKNELERHLADCPDCRNHFQQLKGVTNSLADYRESVASLEPTQAAKQRWARTIQAAGQPKRIEMQKPAPSLTKWWHELFWSSRRAWAGIAAAWLLMWWMNWERPPVHDVAGAFIVTQTFSEERRMLAELMPISNSESADEPRRKPSPHSERQRPWVTA